MELNKQQQEVFNEVLNGDSKVIMLKGEAGTGKALKNGELVLTPKGYTPVEELDYNRSIFGIDGKTYPVIGVHPQGEKECYRITFNDKTQVECCEDHLWEVNGKVLQTKEILKDYKEIEYRIPCLEQALKYSGPPSLKVHPYILGLLLGHHSFISDDFVDIDEEEFGLEELKEYISEWIDLDQPIHRWNKTIPLSMVLSSHLKKNPILTSLDYYKLLGKQQDELFIPKPYFFAKDEHRKLFLKGILDAVGDFNGDFLMSFLVKSKQLALDVIYLARGTGMCVEYIEQVIDGVPHYGMQELQGKGKKIIDIEYIGKYECTCISTNAPRNLFLVNGFNLTHNTYTTMQIAKHFPGEVLVTATTNKAKSILQSSINRQCHTTHSALGFVMTKRGLDLTLSKTNDAKPSDLLIIDETSMLTDRVWKEAKKQLDEGTYKKILLVGDELQLKAVGEGAIIDYDKEFILTQQMRQEDNTELYKFFNTLRNIIKSGTKQNLKDIAPSNISLYTNFKDFADAYNKCDKSKRILAYTNNTVNRYNKNIKGSELYSVGDLLVMDKPVKDIKNGEVVEIIEVNKQSNHTICKVVNELGYIATITIPKSKAVHNEMLSEALDISETEYWLKNNITCFPKHIYASTVHKAQGMTLDEVFIDLTDIYTQTIRVPTRFNNYNLPMTQDEYYRLLYVALSRMKSKAHIFLGRTRDYKYLKWSKNETTSSSS